MSARGLVVAAPRSGSGKTTVTLALIAALRRRGWAVRAAKSGPDYIDAAFHAEATRAPVINLDSWAMPPPLLDALATDAAAPGELLIVESAMGLFDGIAAPPGRSGAAADIAARLRLPVLLVLDVSGQSQSAAAVARGFMTHDPAVTVSGVLLNRVGSERHRQGVTAAVEAIGLPVLGALPREPALALPERHLGLVQASEQGGLPALLDQLADVAERRFDLDGITRLAATLPPTDGAVRHLPSPGQRVALASDAAFSFVYTHLLAGWRAAGAEIVPFSPLADEAPADDCDSCWLPGGYPELHAGRLAAASTFRAGLARFAQDRPVHGECGGYMVLGRSLEDAKGVRHPMTGLLGHATSFARRRLHLGYREAVLRAACPIGAAGAVLRGHEYHYATITEAGADDPLCDLRDGLGKSLGPAGGQRGYVSGSFFHVIAAGEAM